MREKIRNHFFLMVFKWSILKCSTKSNCWVRSEARIQKTLTQPFIYFLLNEHNVASWKMLLLEYQEEKSKFTKWHPSYDWADKNVSANGQRLERRMDRNWSLGGIVANCWCYCWCNICVRKKNHARKSNSSVIVLGQIPPGLKIC